jgi:putative copper export protein
MDAIDIAAELFHGVSMAVFCGGLLFCLACVIDARGYDENDDRA